MLLVLLVVLFSQCVLVCSKHQHEEFAQDICPMNEGGICKLPLHEIRSRSQFGAMTAERNFTVGAELGVQQGYFSDQFLYTALTMKIYHLVDTWSQRSNYSDNANVDNFAQEEKLRNCHKRIDPYMERTQLKFMRMWTTEAAKLIPDNSIDFIYVDARHDWCGVSEDIGAWWPKLRIGGVMAGDDYLTEPEHISIKGGLKDPNDDWGLCGDGTRHQGAVKGAVKHFAKSRDIQVYSTWKADTAGKEKNFWPQWIFESKKTSHHLLTNQLEMRS